MSQGHDKGKRPASGRSSPTKRDGKPKYMAVGSGSVSASGEALMGQLNSDSGYGGSVSDGFSLESDLPPWHPSRSRDIPTPIRATDDGTASADTDRRVLASHIHQLHYNQNRTALARAIGRTVDVLRDLQQMNAAWPAHYPAMGQTEDRSTARPVSRPGLQHAQTTYGEPTHTAESDAVAIRPGPRRAGTSVGDELASSSSAAQETAPEPAPTLITPQAAHDFSILKLDLKLQGLTQSEIAHSMDRRAIASLLEGRINQSVRHLLLLRDRIEDTSSKVLVTGDLNAGKSTFCNALLRRKVLPEDQQPCTSIFCEVLDARENGGIEEVHAVHKDATYDRNNESTYDVYSLQELEKIVVDNDNYNQCKVYVKDVRTIDESLLNNGVVDISIIDAPGLNSDSLQTTAVFARQEEIDVVVFVVSAANHFTLSAKEFIWNAAHEKAYIFIVVNNYDSIRDKQRCQRLILEQVANLSPRTFKESSELVHFVSSNQIPVAPVLPGGGPGGPGGGGSGSGGSSGPSGDQDEDDDDGPRKDGSPGLPPKKGKGKEKENMDDFANLEGALRRFVLEKRARSKLAPAKTYLLNVLSDLNHLATVNRDVAQSELDRVARELDELEPIYEKSKKARNEVSDDIERTIDATCADIYKNTRETINNEIALVAEQELGVEYPGLLNAFQYAEDIKAAILEQISEVVTHCEDDARSQAASGVDTIHGLGQKHLGEDYGDMKFRSDMMFRRKRDALARQIDAPVEVWDFVDVSTIWERQEKVAGSGMALTVVGVLGGRMVGGVGWLDGAMGAARVVGSRNLQKMVVPGLIATVCLATFYVLHSIPYTLPRRLSRRIASTLAEMDYTHFNSTRISNEVGKVLRFPADNLRVGLQHSVEKLGAAREDKHKTKKESEVARKYFANLVRESGEGRRQVEAVDLEGSVPGMAGHYESGAML